MRNRLLSIVFITLAVFCVCGCSEEIEEGALLDDADESVLENDAEGAPLFSENVDMVKIPYPDSASVYQAETRSSPEEKIVDVLFEGTEALFALENDAGKAYVSYLGEPYPGLIRKTLQFNNDTGFIGMHEVFYYMEHIENMAGIEGNNTDHLNQLPVWYARELYSFRENYNAFGHYMAPPPQPDVMEENKSHIQEGMNKLGITDCVYRDGCWYDTETSGLTTETIWVQMVDDIPVCGKPFYDKYASYPGYAVLNAFLNFDYESIGFKDTEIEVHVSNSEIKGWSQQASVVPTAKLTTQQVVPPQKAWETVKDQLQETFPSMSFALEDVELLYTVITYKNRTWYVPVWNVLVSTKEGREAANALPGDRGFWYHNQINAFTGEYFLGWDYGEVNDQNVSE